MDALRVLERHKYIVAGFVTVHFLNLLNLLYRAKKERDQMLEQIEIESNEKADCCFISGEANIECEKHLFQKKPCALPTCSFKNLRKLIEGLSCCRKSLDICIHLLSCVEIAEEILDAYFKRKVKIRILTDSVMATNLGSQIPMLHKAGLEIKTSVESTMHCKFAIVDDSLLLIGSVNWTVQGLHGNWDAFVITSQSNLVEDSVSNFNAMWLHPKSKLFS